MSDINIDLGLIGDDVVALCADATGHYALHATIDKHNQYQVRMSSSHGIISTSTFPKTIGVRQLIMASMVNHIDLVGKVERGEIEGIGVAGNETIN